MFGLHYRALALALVLPLLGGCFVTSKNPVIRAGEDGRDPELRGLWAGETGRELLHVMRPELEDGADEADEAPGFSGLYIVSEGEGPEDRDNWVRVRMISTKVKGTNILSMRFKEGESGGDLEDMPGWLIFSYEVRGGRLNLHMIEEDAVEAAIKSGALKGTVEPRTASDPEVTASSAEWIAWLEQADLDEIFDESEDSGLARLTPDAIRSAAGTSEEADPVQTESAEKDPR